MYLFCKLLLSKIVCNVTNPITCRHINRNLKSLNGYFFSIAISHLYGFRNNWKFFTDSTWTSN